MMKTDKMSSILKGNINELFCYMLFLFLEKNKAEIEINFGGEKTRILDIKIIHHNYGGSQKSDLLVKIEFENKLSQNIYIESKNYKNSTDMNKSLKSSIAEFNSKEEDCEFLDMYLIFTPGEDRINKALDYLNHYTKSNDCYFPRIWKQIENNCISENDTQKIQEKIVDFFKKEGFSIEKKDISDEEKKSVYGKYFENDLLFVKIGGNFLVKIKEFIEDSFNSYIKDDYFDEFCYKNMYKEPQIENLENYNTVMIKLDKFFSKIIENDKKVLHWKEDAIKYCKNYMLRKYGYQNLMSLFEKIEKNEDEIYDCLKEYLDGRDFVDGKDFGDKICNFFTTDNIHDLFKEYITPQFREQNGLFYYKTDNIINKNESGSFTLL